MAIFTAVICVTALRTTQHSLNNLRYHQASSVGQITASTVPAQLCDVNNIWQAQKPLIFMVKYNINMSPPDWRAEASVTNGK